MPYILSNRTWRQYHTINIGQRHTHIQRKMPKETRTCRANIPTREYRMIFRGPGFLAVIWFCSSAPPPPPSVISTGGTQEGWETETTCWWEKGVVEGRIILQESLVFYKLSYFLWNIPCWKHMSGVKLITLRYMCARYIAHRPAEPKTRTIFNKCRGQTIGRVYACFFPLPTFLDEFWHKFQTSSCYHWGSKKQGSVGSFQLLSRSIQINTDRTYERI